MSNSPKVKNNESSDTTYIRQSDFNKSIRVYPFLPYSEDLQLSSTSLFSSRLPYVKSDAFDTAIFIAHLKTKSLPGNENLDAHSIAEKINLSELEHLRKIYEKISQICCDEKLNEKVKELFKKFPEFTSVVDFFDDNLENQVINNTNIFYEYEQYLIEKGKFPNLYSFNALGSEIVKQLSDKFVDIICEEALPTDNIPLLIYGALWCLTKNFDTDLDESRDEIDVNTNFSIRHKLKIFLEYDIYLKTFFDIAVHSLPEFEEKMVYDLNNLCYIEPSYQGRINSQFLEKYGDFSTFQDTIDVITDELKFLFNIKTLQNKVDELNETIKNDSENLEKNTFMPNGKITLYLKKDGEKKPYSIILDGRNCSGVIAFNMDKDDEKKLFSDFDPLQGESEKKYILFDFSLDGSDISPIRGHNINRFFPGLNGNSYMKDYENVKTTCGEIQKEARKIIAFIVEKSFLPQKEKESDSTINKEHDLTIVFNVNTKSFSILASGEYFHTILKKEYFNPQKEESRLLSKIENEDNLFCLEIKSEEEIKAYQEEEKRTQEQEEEQKQIYLMKQISDIYGQHRFFKEIVPVLKELDVQMGVKNNGKKRGKGSHLECKYNGYTTSFSQDIWDNKDALVRDDFKRTMIRDLHVNPQDLLNALIKVFKKNGAKES